MFALWRHHDVIVKDDRHQEAEYGKVRRKYGMLFRQYNGEDWYYEFVEMARKFSLTAGLLLVAERWSVLTGLVIAFFFAITLAHLNPYVDRLDMIMQNSAMTVLFVTLLCAEVLAHFGPQDEELYGYPYTAQIIAPVLVIMNVGLILITMVVLGLVMRRFWETHKEEGRAAPGLRGAVWRTGIMAGKRVAERRQRRKERMRLKRLEKMRKKKGLEFGENATVIEMEEHHANAQLMQHEYNEQQQAKQKHEDHAREQARAKMEARKAAKKKMRGKE